MKVQIPQCFFILLLPVFNCESLSTFDDATQNEITFSIDISNGISKIKVVTPGTISHSVRGEEENGTKSVNSRKLHNAAAVKQEAENRIIKSFSNFEILKVDNDFTQNDTHRDNHTTDKYISELKTNYSNQIRRSERKENDPFNENSKLLIKRSKITAELHKRKDNFNNRFLEPQQHYFNLLDAIKGSYSFGFRTRDQLREESRTPSGVTTGRYGWFDEDGGWHETNFVADKFGFKVASPGQKASSYPDVLKSSNDHTVPHSALFESSPSIEAFPSLYQGDKLYNPINFHEIRQEPNTGQKFKPSVETEKLFGDDYDNGSDEGNEDDEVDDDESDEKDIDEDEDELPVNFHEIRQEPNTGQKFRPSIETENLFGDDYDKGNEENNDENEERDEISAYFHEIRPESNTGQKFKPSVETENLFTDDYDYSSDEDNNDDETHADFYEMKQESNTEQKLKPSVETKYLFRDNNGKKDTEDDNDEEDEISVNFQKIRQEPNTEQKFKHTVETENLFKEGDNGDNIKYNEGNNEVPVTSYHSINHLRKNHQGAEHHNSSDFQEIRQEPNTGQEFNPTVETENLFKEENDDIDRENNDDDDEILATPYHFMDYLRGKQPNIHKFKNSIKDEPKISYLEGYPDKFLVPTHKNNFILPSDFGSPEKYPNISNSERITVANLQDQFFSGLPLKPFKPSISPSLAKPFQHHDNKDLFKESVGSIWPAKTERILSPFGENFGDLSGRANFREDVETNSMKNNLITNRKSYEQNKINNLYLKKQSPPGNFFDYLNHQIQNDINDRKVNYQNRYWPKPKQPYSSMHKNLMPLHTQNSNNPYNSFMPSTSERHGLPFINKPPSIPFNYRQPIYPTYIPPPPPDTLVVAAIYNLNNINPIEQLLHQYSYGNPFEFMYSHSPGEKPLYRPPYSDGQNISPQNFEYPYPHLTPPNIPIPLPPKEAMDYLLLSDEFKLSNGSIATHPDFENIKDLFESEDEDKTNDTNVEIDEPEKFAGSVVKDSAMMNIFDWLVKPHQGDIPTRSANSSIKTTQESVIETTTSSMNKLSNLSSSDNETDPNKIMFKLSTPLISNNVIVPLTPSPPVDDKDNETKNNTTYQKNTIHNQSTKVTPTFGDIFAPDFFTKLLKNLLQYKAKKTFEELESKHNGKYIPIS